MVVRNFWIEADIDGRKTELAGGPRRKDGGFDAVVYIRDDGEISTAVTLRGYVYNDKTILEVKGTDSPNQSFKIIKDRG